MNYARQAATEGPLDPAGVMHYRTLKQVPVLSQLARAFGMSDRWFASAPTQTWPNRFFLHTGGPAGGQVNNERQHYPRILPRRAPSIFNRMAQRGRSWRVYFHDLPQTAALIDLWPYIPTRFRLFARFLQDAQTGRLPNYSFIEPRYYASRVFNRVPNDQHPPHHIIFGEQLLAEIYNALRTGPGWERTLFVVTYDEHGGCYDHVPPPSAVPPGGPYPDGFTFDRYGVRVPAVMVSPWIPAGSIIRPPPGFPYPFDHTSIIATLHRLFDLGPEPTPRAASAPDLLSALSLERPENSGPDHIPLPLDHVTRKQARELAKIKNNTHQRSLRHPTVQIPAQIARFIAHADHGAHRIHRRRR